jgi:hypothetical protein
MNNIRKHVVMILFVIAMTFYGVASVEATQLNYRGTSIPNCSVVIFSADDVIGDVIRLVQKGNNIQNPYGITHAGIVIYAQPGNLYSLIQGKMQTPGTQLNGNLHAGECMLDGIAKVYPHVRGVSTYDPDEPPQLFIAESVGTVARVLDGIGPCVFISPLETVVKGYNGSVHIRPLLPSVEEEPVLEIILSHLGRRYENLAGILEMFRAVDAHNQTQDTERVYCSEFVALVLQTLSLISPEINVSNVIPEELSSGAGEGGDVLRGVAGEDVLIKEDNDNHCCCQVS